MVISKRASSLGLMAGCPFCTPHSFATGRTDCRHAFARAAKLNSSTN